MVITTTHIIAGIYSLVGLLLVAILYNLLFVAVDLRKVTRKMSELSDRFEAMVAAPLSVAEQGVEWVMEYLQQSGKKHNAVHTQEHKKNH